MHTSFKTGLDCKHCTTHKPLQTVDLLYPEMVDSNTHCLEKNLALKINGVFICCKCGIQIGTDDDKEIPHQIGEILQVLIQECLFHIEQIIDIGSGRPMIVLHQRGSVDQAKCCVTWSRDAKWMEDPLKPTQLQAQTLDISALKLRPPPLIEHTLHTLVKRKRAILTEMPKGDKGYAYLGAKIPQYDGRIGDRAFPEHEWDLRPTRKLEQISAPIIVRIEVRWATCPDEQARSEKK